MGNINLNITAVEANILISALKLWGKTRYNKDDKLIAHDLINKVFDAVDKN